jgi:hypothetical protein
MTLPLRGANRPKLANIIANQKISMARNGHWMLVPGLFEDQPARFRNFSGRPESIGLKLLLGIILRGKI